MRERKDREKEPNNGHTTITCTSRRRDIQLGSNDRQPGRLTKYIGRFDCG